MQLTFERDLLARDGDKVRAALQTSHNNALPRKVLITDGREVGGLTSFAEGLSEGFQALGIPAEIIAPSKVLMRWKDLRDITVLKVLSTNAVLAAPIARRAICVAHGFPCAKYQGWPRWLTVLLSLKLAQISYNSRLVSVSQYVAIHLESIFKLRVDGVIHNPLISEFLIPPEAGAERCYITHVGRLYRAKNMHRLLPSLIEVVHQTPGLRVCIIGDGEMRSELERRVEGDPRFEFTGNLDRASIRKRLQRTRVFVSGCETEALGITYLEALSQGCVVAMPACGGGLEIAPDQIGKNIQLLPISFDHQQMTAVLSRAVRVNPERVRLNAYSCHAVAESYLRVDATFKALEAQSATVPKSS